MTTFIVQMCLITERIVHMGRITYRNRMYTPVFSTWEKLSRRNKKDFDSKQSEAHIFLDKKKITKKNLNTWFTPKYVRGTVIEIGLNPKTKKTEYT